MAVSFAKKISKVSQIPFTTSSYGLCTISIKASCASKDDGLRIEIDSRKFREIPPEDKAQYVNIPPTWNGSQLIGLNKTVVFILMLKKGEHTLIFIPTGHATIDNYEIATVHNSQQIEFNLHQQAQDGDRRPWYTFVLIDLPLISMSVDASVSWHFWDGDDIKLIIDSTVKINDESRLHKYWAWHSNPLKSLLKKEREIKSSTENLSSGIHYIEFWADRNPTLHLVTLNVGHVPVKRIPTVDDPEWTGNFEDDTEQMILARAIYGECRDVLYPDTARIAIGWTIRNRVEDKKRWADTYVEVITQDWQYSAFNKNDSNILYVENPYLGLTQEDEKAPWRNVYSIAGKVINGTISDPTHGANHYFDNSIDPPPWAKKEKPVLRIYNSTRKAFISFYRLWV